MNEKENITYENLKKAGDVFLKHGFPKLFFELRHPNGVVWKKWETAEGILWTRHQR